MMTFIQIHAKEKTVILKSFDHDHGTFVIQTHNHKIISDYNGFGGEVMPQSGKVI